MPILEIEERVARLEGRVDEQLRFKKGIKDITLHPDRKNMPLLLEERIAYLEDVVEKFFND